MSVAETKLEAANGSLLEKETDGTLSGSSSSISSGEKKEVKPKVKPSQVINLFRYASCGDLLLMLLGFLCAVAHGAALPILMLYFGSLADGFIFQAISSSLAQDISNQTGISDITCMSALNFTLGNVTFVESTITSIFESFPDPRLQNIECLLDSEFIMEINEIVYVFVGIAVAVMIVSSLQIATFQFTAERQVYKIRVRYYRAILRQDIAWFDANPTGELVNRLSDDIDKIYAGIGDKLAILIQWLTSFFAGFAVAFSQEWRLTLLLLAFTPFMAVSGAILAKLTAAFTTKEQKQYAAAGTVAEEVLSSIRTVFAFGGETKEVARYDDKLNQALRLGVKKGFSVGLSLAVIFFFLFSIYGVGFGFGGYLVAEEGANGGDILTVFFSVVIGAFSLGQAVPNLENLLTAAGAATTVYETIDRTPPIDSSSEEGLQPEKFDPTIELKNVNFTYPTRPDVQVMHDVSLSAEVGKTVALVGPSGCGKSTVVQLIQRFYDVDSGEVLVGGFNVKDLNLKWLRKHIGVVSQEPVLFDTTIAENIRFGRDEATMDDITDAAKAANAHDFIMSLPKGYETNVGEGGTQLSGGQKQRVAIARALVSNPRILLLDEATSALDTESEAVVQEALDKAREGRTTIVIAHRLSTIQNSDTITSLNKGQVMERGTHTELMEKKSLYYDLVQAQSFGTDQLFIETKSLGRLFSRTTSKDAEVSRQPSHQRSYQKQKSVEGNKDQKKLSDSKKQEEWDKEIPEVGLFRVVSLNAKEWWLIVLGVLGAALNGSIFPLFAFVFGEILRIFSLSGEELLDSIGLWAGMFVVLGVVSGLGVFLKTFCFTIAGENLTSRLRSLLFKAFLRQEIGWYDDERNSTGALTTRLAHDAGQVQGATGSRIGTLAETCIGLLLAIGIAFAFSWLITFVILGVVPLVVIAGAFQLRVFTNHASKTKKDLEMAGKLAVDSIDNIRTVASLAIEEKFGTKYTEEVTRPHKSSILIHPISYGMTYSFSQATIYLMYAVVFRFGAFLVIQDPDSVLFVEYQDVFRVFMAVVFGALSVGQASAFAPNYAKAKISANRIFAILDRKPLIDNYSTEGEKLENFKGSLKVEKVHFSYPSRPEVPVLQELSVDITPGETLALVGPSGCGKSTIVSLIERFYDPSSGSVMLEEKDARELNISWLRSQIGIVSQEPVLFDASIAENIRYGALFREVSDDEVIGAAKAANIHSFIETLPQGYNTNVGAKGTQLSGGQKQRIAIARALVRDPKVLLLDEATSALDTESEKVVQEALDKAREGRTTIVIAHRLSTIYNSDKIAVIKDGQVLEAGTHTELLTNKGLYYKLNRFQMVNEVVTEVEE